MVQSGAFNVDLCDAIMRLWAYLDRRMYQYYVKYGEIHKTWRHFLPATFAVHYYHCPSVITESTSYSFLYDILESPNTI